MQIIDLTGEDPGTRARQQFRLACVAQGEILQNIVLYSPPGTRLDLERLLQEHNGPVLAAAKELRAFYAAHPEAQCPDPNVIVLDLTNEDP